MMFSNTLHINCHTFPDEYSTHATNVLCGLDELRQSGSLFDVSLIIEGQRFQAHRVVLASCSSYFRAMFTDDMKETKQDEIILQDVPAVGMKLILDYIYAGSLSLEPDTIEDALSAANHLQIIPVLNLCCLYLKERLNFENCLDVLSLADRYSLFDLEKRIYIFICSKLLKFSQTNEFKSLKYKQMERILSSDYPVDCSENNVLQVVLKWIFSVEHDEDKLNTDQVRHLLQYINFHEIPHISEFEIDRPLANDEIRRMPLQKYFVSNEDDVSSKFVVNTRGLDQSITLIGGVGSRGLTNDIVYFHVSSGKWKRLTTIPHLAQFNYGTAVFNNKLYILGGSYTQMTQENIHPYGLCYDPQTNAWHTVARMCHERCRFTLTVVQDKLYAIGGWNDMHDGVDLGEFNEFIHGECYDPDANSWSSIPALRECRSQHAATACPENGHYLYVSGGITTISAVVLKTFWRYDTLDKIWDKRPNMLTHRADHVMLTIKGNIYVCGGWSETTPAGSKTLVESVDVYVPEQETWRTVTTLPTPRHHSGIVAVGEDIYFIGGYYVNAVFQSAIYLIECYNVTYNTWKNYGRYPQAIWEHASLSLCISRHREDEELVPDSE